MAVFDTAGVNLFSSSPLISLIMYLIHLPLNYFEGFYWEHKFELSNQTFGQWIKDSLKKNALGLAKKIASKSANSTAMILEAIRKTQNSTPEEGLAHEAKLFGRICETRDMQEGLSAFIEKRQPQFKDQ